VCNGEADAEEDPGAEDDVVVEEDDDEFWSELEHPAISTIAPSAIAQRPCRRIKFSSLARQLRKEFSSTFQA